MKRTMLKIFLMLMCAALIPSPFLLGNEPAVTDLMRQRSLVSNGDPARLQAVLAKARRGEPICIAAIGGSITAGGDHTKDPAHRYIQQLAKWFEGTFPGLKVRFVNAGIGATNSGYGALRVQRDVIACQPDLVVVEYAVNDGTGIATLDESYEGVLRQLLASSTNRAVIELFFMHKDGKSAQPEQETLGRHYGLPMISFRDAVWPELQAGKLKWETIYDDVVHPNNAGHDIASELLRSFLTASLDKLPKHDRDLPAVAPMPAPLLSDTFERCTMFRAADLKPLSSAGWSCGKSNVWECGSAGGRLEYEVTGTVLMLGRTIPEVASNRVELIVDGGPPRPVLRDGHNLPVAKGLAAGRHRVAVVVQPFGGGKESADKVQIWWGGAAGLAGVAAESAATSKDEPGRLVVCFASKGAFTHTPGSEAGLRGLAGLLHKYGYRGTYYLKPATVRACQADLKEWREKYGDEVGWFAENCSLKSAAAELAELRKLAIGQPIRSAGQLRYGKDWVEFFQKHGVESVWGRCYEQTATDGITDRGCPFGFYYARPDCFKAPNPGSGGVISVPWLSNDLNLVFRTAQQSTFTFDPNDPQDIGVATPGDDSFWVAELNEYKKQTKYNKIVPLVIQQEIEEFDFTTRKGWKESGSVIFENLLKVLKREGIQVVTVTEAVDLYKAAYPEATPPTYGLFGNIAATTPIISNNKSLQVVTAPFAIARQAEFKCFGPTFNGFYATGRIGRTWYYYDSKGARLDEFGKNFSYFDKAGLLVFEEGNSTPVRITPYSNLPADAYKTAILPEMSPWFDTQKLIPIANVKMVKSERELRVTASTVASRSLVFSGGSLPYGVMLWGDFSAYRVPSNAPAGTKILGNEGLFIPWVLKEGENHLDLGFGVESSSIGKASPSIAADAPIAITDLRTEGVSQPMGIEEAAPRFSWRYAASAEAPRGFRQSAYRVQVASSLEKLSRGPADLWDSGKLAGSDTLAVLYAGQPLQSATRYFWQVTGFDATGKTYLSPPHYFETGLMKAKDWGEAEWIGARNERPKTIPANLQRLGDATFETRFHILDGSAVVLFQTTYAWGKENKLEIQTGQPGKLIVTPFDPKNKSAAAKEFVLPMNIAPGTWHSLKIVRQGARTTFEIDGQKIAEVVLPDDAGKTGTLALGASTKPKQGIVQYDDFRLAAGGETLVQESFDNPAVFAFQEFFHSKKSYSLVKNGVLEVRALNTCLDPKDGLAAPLFRKTFSTEPKKIVRARAYVSGLGYYTFWLNGKRLDDFLLHPGFARFNKTAYYTVYDLTGHLAADNALAFELGRGWYAMTTPTLWGETFAGDWMAEPALRVLVTIDYADGSRQTVASNPSFKTTAGPILVDSVKAGEIYDARQELPGWNSVRFDDKNWSPAVVAKGKMPSAAPGLTAQLFEPIRVVESVSPVSIEKVADEEDAWVVDFGRNMAGTVELKVRAEAGQKIRLNHLETIVDRHGRERWNNFGPKDTGSFQTDIYIAKGGGEECYQARYSYKGFRYVHIMGLKEKPRPDQVTAKVFNSDMASVGDFRSSSELWNKIWNAGRRCIQSNMHSIPTDCPQWEKLGWTCDDASPFYAMAFNYDLRKLYEKRLQDYADDISPDGRIRNTVPSSWAKGDDPAWVGSYVNLVWKHYQTYGDRRMIERHFDNLKLYMSTLIKEGEASEKPPLLTKPRKSLGDWVNPDDNCPPEGALIYYDCYFYKYLRMMADLATVLGRTEEATYYTNLATQLKKQFNDFFFDEKEGCYYSSNRAAGFRQSPQAIALAFGLVPEDRAPRVVKRLVQDIHDRKDHFWTGILGMEAIADALCDNGQTNVAYSAHLKDDGPSLGNMIREGATSLWESYSDKNARSLNHKMFATPLGWMARYVAGLHADGVLGEGVGFRKVVISPHPAPALLQFAELDYDSPVGRYHSGWKVVPEGLLFSLEIPPNAAAEFKVPIGGVKNPTILESRRPVWKDGRFQQGVNGVSAGSGKASDISLELASGKYEFLLKPGMTHGDATLIRQLQPLSVRGVNYFPRETPWGGMWTKTPADVWEKDMALAESLGCNTIRTFVQFAPHIEQAGLLEKDGTPTPAYLDKIETLLATAWRHHIRVIVCFEFSPGWLEARWKPALAAIVTAHRDDGRVLLWDLMNEPDDDAKWTEATRAYLKAALPFIKQLDTNHLTTVGLTWRVDRLEKVGLPDVMQYHEYAGKEIFFKEGPQRVLVTISHQRQVGGARPLFIGEFGMSTARDEQHGVAPELRAKIGAPPGTEAEQARLYEIVLAGAEQGHAAGALAWCLHDYPIKNPNESHFGLVRTDGTLKPAALVLRNVYSRWSRPGFR